MTAIVNTRMIAKCANPACSRAFRYLHEGRLFAIERYDTTARDGNHESEFASSPYVLEFYWLCNDCCSRGVLSLARGNGEMTFLPKPVNQYRENAGDVVENNFEKEAA